MNLLFDLDGTLIDSADGIRWCAKRTFELLGLPLSELNEVPVGPPILATIRKHLGEYADSHFDEARRTYQNLYSMEGLKMVAVYDEIEKVVTELAQSNSLYIVTSKAEIFAQTIVKNLGWDKLFRRVYGSGLNGEFMDKPELLKNVLNTEQLKLPVTRMIGDRSHDIIAAQKNGVRPIGVLWGYGSSDEMNTAGASKILSHPLQLLDLDI